MTPVLSIINEGTTTILLSIVVWQFRDLKPVLLRLVNVMDKLDKKL